MFNRTWEYVEGDSLMRVLGMLLLGMLAISHASVHALGLGQIDTDSAINEPLRAEIKLLSIEDTALRTIRVQLAQPDDFRQAGVELTPVLKQIKFRVLRQAPGQAVIQVYSGTPVKEAYLNFLIQVDWPNGRLLREYTVLLDPPTTTDRQALKIAPVAGQVKLTPIQATPSSVSAGRTLTRTDEYGPVKPKETLWGIAERVRPKGVTMQQMMSALQRANPQAFIGGNMNRLRKGQILRVPDLEEILSISPAQAEALFRQQLNTWSRPTDKASSSQLNNSLIVDKKSTKAPVAQSNAGQSQANAVTRQVQRASDRLQIATARPGGDAKAGASEGQGNIQSNYQLTEQLMRARENAETARQESNILRSEIDDLQARLSDMQRLLTLKDEQLAQLQDTFQQRQEVAARAQDADSVLPPLPPESTESQPLINPETVDNVGEVETQASVTPVESKQDQAMQSVSQPDMDNQPTQQNDWWENFIASMANGISSVIQPVYLAGLGVILLLLLVLLIIRRKRNEREVEEIALQDPFDPDYTTTPTSSSANQVLDDNDPINQADLHIAYGRFQQAEAVLKQAGQDAPERSDVRYKLFEVYHATQNATAYSALAQQMLNDNQHLDDPEAWAEVTAMGAELIPDDPLFQSNQFEAPSARQDTYANEIEFDLSDQPSSAGYAQAFDDFKPQVKSSDTEAQLVLDQPLDIERAFQSVVNENSHVAPANAEPVEPENEDVKNKLDLARVYIDMGDAEGARDILQEVQEEGSQHQKNQAAELIAQIS